MKKIDFFKPTLINEDYKVIKDSLKTGWLTHGPKNLEFENKFCKLIGVKYAISMNSCTSALECALKVIKKKRRSNYSKLDLGNHRQCCFKYRKYSGFCRC